MNHTNDRYPCEFEPPDVMYCIFARHKDSTEWYEQETTKDRSLAEAWLSKNRGRGTDRVFALVKRVTTHTEIA